jgi:hypothetical protein
MNRTTPQMAAKRVVNLIQFSEEVDVLIQRYLDLATDLLCWISVKILYLENRSFPNSLVDVQKLVGDFKAYRLVCCASPIPSSLQSSSLRPSFP